MRVEIEYKDGSKKECEFIPIYALMAALDRGEIRSFKVIK